MEESIRTPRSATRQGLWDEFVVQGRRLVAKEGEAKWELGDLAIKLADIGAPSQLTGAYEPLRAFADEIGIPFDTLRTYRETAGKWPPQQRRPDVSWTVHHQLRHFDGRVNLINSRKRWSCKDAQAALARVRKNARAVAIHVVGAGPERGSLAGAEIPVVRGSGPSHQSSAIDQPDRRAPDADSTTTSQTWTRTPRARSGTMTRCTSPTPCGRC